MGKTGRSLRVAQAKFACDSVTSNPRLRSLGIILDRVAIILATFSLSQVWSLIAAVAPAMLIESVVQKLRADTTIGDEAKASLDMKRKQLDLLFSRV